MVVDHSAEKGGAQLALSRMVEALVRRDVEVHVCLLSQGPMGDIYRKFDCEVTELTHEGFASATRHGSHATLAAKLAAGAITSTRSLAELIDTWAPTHLHANTPKSWLAALLASRGKPHRLTFHVRDILSDEVFPWPSGPVLRAMARMPALTVCNSTATLKSLGYNSPRSVVLASPAALGSPPEDRPNLEPGRPIRLLTVSRFDWWKGHDNAVLVTKALNDLGVDAYLRIVGDERLSRSGEAQRLRDLVATTKTEAVVDFAGWSDDVASELANADIFLHLPKAAEPLGQVVIEALSQGLIVGIDPAGGPGELVMDGLNGLHLTSSNPMLCALRIRSVLKSPEIQDGLRACAIESAKSLAPERIADEFIDLLTNLEPI